MRVFLTGGSGLIGSHVAERLVGDGHEVVALVRPSTDVRHLVGLGCTLASGWLGDPVDALARALAGCTHLVHSAAVVYSGGLWEDVHAVNVEGTRSVMEAAAIAGIQGALHVSSVSVYGGAEGPVDEDVPLTAPLPAADTYARSKREAEEVARRVEAERGLPVTVLRPAAVYGERDRLLSPRIARITRGPVAFLLGHGGNTTPTVYAGNVADAIAVLLERNEGGSCYDLGMDHPLTQRMLQEGIARGMGRRPRFVALPAWLVRGGAKLLQRIGVSAPGAEGLPLERLVRLALGENPYGSRRLRSRLGWRPPHRHEQALERTGRWLAKHMTDGQE